MSRKTRGRSTRRQEYRWLPALTVTAVLATAVLALTTGRVGGVAAQTAQFAEAGGIQGSAEDLDLAAYAGSVVVVNFMAGWCVACWTEIPGFVELYSEHRPGGLVVLAISLQTPESQTEAMIEQLGISYPVYQDELGMVAVERFGLRAMPTTVIYDRQGREVQRFNGEVSAPALRRVVEALL